MYIDRTDETSEEFLSLGDTAKANKQGSNISELNQMLPPIKKRSKQVNLGKIISELKIRLLENQRTEINKNLKELKGGELIGKSWERSLRSAAVCDRTEKSECKKLEKMSVWDFPKMKFLGNRQAV